MLLLLLHLLLLMRLRLHLCRRVVFGLADCRSTFGLVFIGSISLLALLYVRVFVYRYIYNYLKHCSLVVLCHFVVIICFRLYFIRLWCCCLIPAMKVPSFLASKSKKSLHKDVKLLKCPASLKFVCSFQCLTWYLVCFVSQLAWKLI